MKKAVLKIDDKEFEFSILESTSGPKAIDMTNLFKESGYFSYDPGFLSTAQCSSKITFIDGQEGVLKHRGYDIEYLAENHSFLEIAYLLLNEDLPNKVQYQDFYQEIIGHRLINERLMNIFNSFRYTAHPMAVLLATIGSLSAFYHDDLDINDPEQRYKVAVRIIAKIPTIAAMTYKNAIGQPYIYPRNNLNFTENFLNMMFATPCEDYKISKAVSKALNKIFILHADHEQNASTTAVRTVGSSGANPYACISAGIASLWGPSHGGANEAVIKMLEQIGSPENIPHFIERAKDKSDPFKLMGFGHRVYKSYDPRASVLKKSCDEVLEELGVHNSLLLLVAKELENIALHDEYFVSRKLYPNVDFYSGIIYKAIGIPTNMFTVLFAVARSAGWISQWKEMREDSKYKIYRPRQLYIGKDK